MLHQLTPVILRARPALRLFCFPYAGGSGWTYYSWPEYLPTDVEVWTATPAGRGRRCDEAPMHTIAAIVDDFASAIGPLLDRPYAVFGHSMGALVGFELIRRLGTPAPVALFASGAAAPSMRDDVTPLHDLPDEALLEEVRTYNGIPEAFGDSTDLLRALLPTIRADFEAAETYEYVPGPPVAAPIVVFGGTDDPYVTMSKLEAWRQLSSRSSVVRLYPGGHFFIHDMAKEICSVITDTLVRVQRPSAFLL